MTSGVWGGIWNDLAAPTNLQMNNNVFSNNSTTTTSGLIYNIYNSGAVTGNITISGNTLGNMSFPSGIFTGTFYNCWNSVAISTTNLTVSDNNTYNVTFTNAAATAATIYFHFLQGSPNTLVLDNNHLVNLTLNHGGAEFCFNDNTSVQTSKIITNNGITGSFTRTTAAGNLTCLVSNGSTIAVPVYTVSGK